MPNLRQLLEELEELGVDPTQIKLPGPLYDELLDQAEDLAASAKEGNQDAQMIFLFLSTVTYDQLTELVKPYEQNEELLQYIKKLSENKEWVEEALAGIRRLVA